MCLSEERPLDQTGDVPCLIVDGPRWDLNSELVIPLPLDLPLLSGAQHPGTPARERFARRKMLDPCARGTPWWSQDSDGEGKMVGSLALSHQLSVGWRRNCPCPGEGTGATGR